MKEKTAELKEKIEKGYRDMMEVINSTSLPLFVEDTIEDMHILIKTFIAENKELKEENLHWKGQYHLLSRKIDVISKSKVEEILNKYKHTQIGDNKKIIQFYRELKSLLGKE